MQETRVWSQVWEDPTWWRESRSVVSNSLQPRGLHSPWNSPGQNTGVGSLSLLQEIFPTQASNPGLPHCRQIVYQLSHKGSAGKQEWVAYSFSADLPDPGTEPRSPTCQGAISQSCQNYWACAREPTLCNKRSRRSEKLTNRNYRVAPACQN